MSMRPGRAVLAGLPLLLAVGSCDAPPHDRGRLLVTSGFTDQVFVLDAATGAVLDSLSLDRRPGERDEPHGVAVAPDGRLWYATLSHGEATLWKYEAAGNRLVGRLTLPTAGASRVRLSPDGTLAAVPDYWRSGPGGHGRVAVVRTEDLTVVGAPAVCEAPHDAVFSPSGDRIAVTCSRGREVVVLEVQGLTVSGRYAVTDVALPPPRPMNAAWSPDGQTLWVSLMGRGSVVELELDTGRRLERPTGEAPAQVALSPDGRLLAVANRGDASLSLLSVGTGVDGRVAVPGAHPHGVAFDPVRPVAYLTYEGDVETPGGVVAVDAMQRRVLWHSPLGVFTLGVAYLPRAAGDRRR
jgi:DNA-binding beta-propeller fold protein YncE